MAGKAALGLGWEKGGQESVEGGARQVGLKDAVDPDVRSARTGVAAAAASEDHVCGEAVVFEKLLDAREVFAVAARETGASHAKRDGGGGRHDVTLESWKDGMVEYWKKEETARGGF